MQQDILDQLIQIKWTLFVFFVCLIVIGLFRVISEYFRVKTETSQMLLKARDNYLAEIALHEIQGEYLEILEKSANMLEQYPNDLMANWYHALGNWKLQQHGAALTALGRIKEINASWSADLVDDMISRVRSEMDGPRASSS